jgi:hypothetical protein
VAAPAGSRRSPSGWSGAYLEDEVERCVRGAPDVGHARLVEELPPPGLAHLVAEGVGPVVSEGRGVQRIVEPARKTRPTELWASLGVSPAIGSTSSRVPSLASACRTWVSVPRGSPCHASGRGSTRGRRRLAIRFRCPGQ